MAQESSVRLIQQYLALCHSQVDRIEGNYVELEQRIYYLSIIVANAYGSDRLVLNLLQTDTCVRKDLFALDDHFTQTDLRQ